MDTGAKDKYNEFRDSARDVRFSVNRPSEAKG